MKAGIHPAYNKKITVTCSCGQTFQTGSTEAEIAVEVCSSCHPFYTGKQKFVGTAGRVDKFKKRLKSRVEIQEKARRTKRKSKAETKLG